MYSYLISTLSCCGFLACVVWAWQQFILDFRRSKTRFYWIFHLTWTHRYILCQWYLHLTMLFCRFLFKAKEHGHMLTKDLWLLITSWGKNKGTKLLKEYGNGSELVFWLKSCTDNYYTKHSIHRYNLSKWKENILTFIDYKALELSKQARYNTFSILIELSPNNNLNDLQASNNALFICLRFFSLKFWLKNLDFKTMLYLILIAVFLNLMDILLEVTKLFFKPLTKTFFT